MSLHNIEWLSIPSILIACNYVIRCNLPRYIDTKRCIIFRSIVHYIAIEYETSRLCNTILRLANCIQEFVNCTLNASITCTYLFEKLELRIRVTSFFSHHGYRRWFFTATRKWNNSACGAIERYSMSATGKYVDICPDTVSLHVYQRERSHRKFSDKSWNGL